MDTEKALKTSAAALGKGRSSPQSPAKITPKTDAVVPSNESAEAPASPAEPVGDHAVPSRPADIPIDLHAPLGDPLLRTPQTPVLPLPAVQPVVSGEPSGLKAMLSTLVASQENCHITLKELVSEQKGLKTKIDALQTQQGKLQTDLDRESRIVRAMQGELQKHLAASKKAQEADDARVLDSAPLKRSLEEIEERLATGVCEEVRGILQELTELSSEFQDRLDQLPQTTCLAGHKETVGEIKAIKEDVRKLSESVSSEFETLGRSVRGHAAQDTRSAAERRRFAGMIGCITNGLREGLQTYHNRRENASDPRQDPLRPSREDASRRNLRM